MGFQTRVQAQPGVAVAGDFAGANPRASVLAGPGQLVAPAGGLIVGRFAFVDPATGLVSQTFAAGNLVGFLHREMQGLITTYLADATEIVPQGFPITLMSAGDFWASFAAGAVIGAPVNATPADGTPTTAAGTATKWTVGSTAAAGELAKITTWG